VTPRVTKRRPTKWAATSPLEGSVKVASTRGFTTCLVAACRDRGDGQWGLMAEACLACGWVRLSRGVRPASSRRGSRTRTADGVHDRDAARLLRPSRQRRITASPHRRPTRRRERSVSLARYHEVCTTRALWKGCLLMDLYRLLARQQRLEPAAVRADAVRPGPRPGPMTGITEAVESTDEERAGALLGAVAP
jgi:hypothetical protein